MEGSKEGILVLAVFLNKMMLSTVEDLLALSVCFLFLYSCAHYMSIGKRKRPSFFLEDLTIFAVSVERLLQRFICF